MRPSRGFGQEARLIMPFLVREPTMAAPCPCTTTPCRAAQLKLQLTYTEHSPGPGQAHSVFRISPAAAHVDKWKKGRDLPRVTEEVSNSTRPGITAPDSPTSALCPLKRVSKEGRESQRSQHLNTGQGGLWRGRGVQSPQPWACAHSGQPLCTHGILHL